MNSPTKEGLLNALLHIYNGIPTARWNFPQSIGAPASSQQGLGSPVVVTYGFLDSPPSGYPWGSDFKPFSSEYKEAAGKALQLYADCASIAFAAQANAESASLAFGHNAQPESNGGFAYSPAFSWTTSHASANILTATEIPEGGDIWLNSKITYNSSELLPGEQGFGTILHEIGHALGLKHPFEDGKILNEKHDTNQYSIMSYSNHPHSKVLEFSVQGDSSSYSYSYTLKNLEPRSLMLGDILAIQELYGANKSFRNRADRYKYSDFDVFIETLWDGGGIDTIDLTSMKLPSNISLQQGDFSSIGIRTTDAQLRDLFSIPDFVEIDLDMLSTSLYNGTNNLAIAYGCKIENCYGGSGNDRIKGNGLRNTLKGGLGNDSIFSGTGNDRVEGGFGNDRINGGRGRDTAVFSSRANRINLNTTKRQNTGDGRDRLISIENVDAGAGNDVVTGNKAANILNGQKGNDRLYGRAGNDLLIGGGGRDRLWGQAGRDTFRIIKGTGYTIIEDFTDQQDRIHLGSGRSGLRMIDRDNDIYVYLRKDLMAIVDDAAGKLQIAGNYLV